MCDYKPTVDIWDYRMSHPFPDDCGKPVDPQAGPLRELVNGKGEPPLTLLDRLSVTRGVWELLDVQPEEATKLLLMQPSGTFIVASNGAAGSASRVLLLRMEEDGSDTVRHFHIKEDGAGSVVSSHRLGGIYRERAGHWPVSPAPYGNFRQLPPTPFLSPPAAAAIYLEGSQLRFRDPVELIGFHVVSRDILPCLLRIPDAFRLPCKRGLDAVVALGMKFWMMLLPPGSELTPTKVEKKPLGLNGDPLEPEQPVCSIRVTSEDGALCAINPLFLSVHSDDNWLDFMPSLCRSSNTRGTLKLWNGLERARTSDSDSVSREGTCPTQECLDHRKLQEEEEEEKSNFLPCSSSLRRNSFYRSLARQSSEHASEVPPPSPEPKEIRPPHRVSWIEGIPVTTPPSQPLEKSSSELSLLSETMLLPLIPELDSLSVSSMEEEGDTLTLASATTSQKKRHSSSAALPYKVLHRLSAVGSALSGLLSTERRISNRVQELAQEPTSYLGGLVQSFVGHILRGARMRHPTSTDMLQEIRQMLSSLKGYLCESSELRVFADHIEAEELDLGSVVETALYKCMLKPLRDAIYTQLLEFRTRDGTVGRLHEHQATMKQQSLGELGVTACVPDGAGLDRIRIKLNLLHRAYSPKKKEVEMLKICKMLYEAMNQAAGRTEPFGADDFLPVLTYTLVNCDIVSVQLDVEYMMELMDPTQLQGEGGYYLTTWFGALYHIANFQPAAMLTRQISLEAQHSIHQWHRRRTIHHHHHHHHHQQVARSHSQNILYVSFLEPFSNQKTLSVPPDMTAASVCAACARKYGVSNPKAYGLFLVSSDSSQLLASDCCPQRLRSAIFISQGPPMSFVYKTLDGALPAADPVSLHDPNKWTETQKALRSGHLERD